jgi:hypothetical protein
VQLVSTWGRNGRVLRESTSLQKTAAHSPAEEYVRSVDPEPGKSIVLVIGLGDHETYGPNRNGDSFPSEPIRGKIASDEVLPKHYKSYEKAHVFEHHVNDNPAKAIGRVRKAFWNPHMRRVEVIEDFDHKKAPHLLEKIGSGEYPAKSMGCRIKYDVCTVCGNKACTRSEYCDHLKYAMSRIDPHSGIQNAALNPSPDFFDSSWVIRPADRTGFMLKKVAKATIYEISTNSADLGDLRDDLASKSAALNKAADIEKVMSGKPAATVSNLDAQDAQLIDRYKAHCESSGEGSKPNDDIVRLMITFNPAEALGTADGVGMPLGIKELIQYFLERMGTGAAEDLGPQSDSIKKSASDHLELIYEVFAHYPRFFDEVVKVGQLSNPPVFNQTLATKMAAFTPSNVTQSYIHRSVMPAWARGDERPLTDTMHWTDPNTGQEYTTNYGTVQKTNDALVRQGLQTKAMRAAPYLGASALLGGATLGMHLSPKLRGMPQIAAGLGALATGAMGLNELSQQTPIAGPKVMTDEGETISGWTEMARGPYKYAQEIPELAYVVRRVRDGKISPLTAKYAADFLASLKSAEIHDELADFVGPTLQLEKVAEALGKSILLRAS